MRWNWHFFSSIPTATYFARGRIVPGSRLVAPRLLLRPLEVGESNCPGDPKAASKAEGSEGQQADTQQAPATPVSTGNIPVARAGVPCAEHGGAAAIRDVANILPGYRRRRVRLRSVLALGAARRRGRQTGIAGGVISNSIDTA